MTWLLGLYPPRWRRRYGAEFLALIAPQQFSIMTTIDIIGGAIDAWTQPQAHLSRAASHPEGDTMTLAKTMRLRCAGYGTKVTMTDSLKGAGMILGGALLSIVLARWLRQAGQPSLATALMTNGWLISFVFSMRFTMLKGWPGRTQAVFMGWLASTIVAITLLAAWIGRA